jgi:hypothetical protein
MVRSTGRLAYLVPWISFFAMTGGFLSFTYNGVRQSIAISFFYIAVQFIIKRRFFYYCLTILMATLFHYSAFFLLPVYFVRKIKFRPRLVLMLYFSSLIFILMPQLISYSLSLLSQLLTDFTQIPFMDGYTHYLTKSKEFGINADRVNTGLGIILKAISVLFILMMSKRVLAKIEDFSCYYVLFFLGAILSNVFFAVPIVGRFLNYFTYLFPFVAATTIYEAVYNTQITAFLARMMIVSYYTLFIVHFSFNV